MAREEDLSLTSRNKKNPPLRDSKDGDASEADFSQPPVDMVRQLVQLMAKMQRRQIEAEKRRATAGEERQKQWMTMQKQA